MSSNYQNELMDIHNRNEIARKRRIELLHELAELDRQVENDAKRTIAIAYTLATQAAAGELPVSMPTEPVLPMSGDPALAVDLSDPEIGRLL